MKKYFLVGMGLLLASLSFAQTNLDGGQKSSKASGTVVGGIRSDSTFTPLRFDSNGYQYVTEATPPQSYQIIQPSVLSSNFLHIPGVAPSGTTNVPDSSSAIYVGGYSRLALLIYPTCDDSTWAATVALSWALHSSATADSQSTFWEQPWNRFARGPGTLGAADTSLVRPDTIGTLNPSIINLIQQAVPSPTVNALDTLATPGENVLVIQNVASSKRGILVYLTNRDGQPVSGLYASFRWRHLNTYLNTGTNAAWTSAASFNPAGHPRELRLRLRADLVGWR